ncbi:HPr family phosphocarrier protein [Velocimicrobium porci]|nr:HPr family phosphocarrier protein [Velocimicrobium porci]
MVRQTITVCNSNGFHIRPVTIIADAASGCTSKVTIHYEHNQINARSILNLLSFGIKKGTDIIVECEGEHEQEDLEKMVDVILHKLEKEEE